MGRMAEAVGQQRCQVKDSGLRQLLSGEQWEKTHKRLVLVPGSGDTFLPDPLPHAQRAVLVQGQASVTSTGLVMPHSADEAVTVPAVKGPAWPGLTFIVTA